MAATELEKNKLVAVGDEKTEECAPSKDDKVAPTAGGGGSEGLTGTEGLGRLTAAAGKDVDGLTATEEGEGEGPAAAEGKEFGEPAAELAPTSSCGAEAEMGGGEGGLTGDVGGALGCV